MLRPFLQACAVAMSLVLTLGLGGFGGGFAQAQTLDLVTMTYQGVERSYWVHVPAALAGRRGNPAVLVFHGGAGDGRNIATASRMAEAADGESRDGETRGGEFVAIFPNGPGIQWNDGRAETRSEFDDVGFVRALIAEAAVRQGVDPERVFAAGISNGGMFVQRLACEAPEAFRAMGVVVANMPADLAPVCAPARALPMLFITGDADRLMPFEGGEISAIRILGIGVGGTVLSQAETAAFWRGVAGCAGGSDAQALPDIADDGTRVMRETVTQCVDGAELDFYTVAGGGHNWPGSSGGGRFAGNISQDIDATAEILDFFGRHGL